MLTGTLTAMFTLSGVSGILNTGLPVWVLAAGMAAVLGWWVGGFSLRYGQGLLHCYQSCRPFDEARLFFWAIGASAGRGLPQFAGVPGLAAPAVRVSKTLLLLSSCLLALLALVLAGRFGLSLPFWCALLVLAVLFALTIIDAQTMLLPDALTYSLLWMGMLAHWVPGLALVGLADSVLGVVAGYGVLLVLFWLYQLVRQREGMGRGDFKLVAAFGAWLGWEGLPLVLLLACCLSVGFTVCFLPRHAWKTPYPFGPFLVAGFILTVAGIPALHFKV